MTAPTLSGAKPRPTALFVVGEPGAGKTTLVRGILGHNLDSYRLNLKPKWTFNATTCAAGHYTGDAFDGADTVGYGEIYKTLDFWIERLLDRPLAIFDGDRFSFPGALEVISRHARVACVHVDVEAARAVERRATRAAGLGRKLQNASWVTGRATKAKRFAQLFPLGRVMRVRNDFNPEWAAEATVNFVENLLVQA